MEEIKSFLFNFPLQLSHYKRIFPIIPCEFIWESQLFKKARWISPNKAWKALIEQAEITFFVKLFPSVQFPHPENCWYKHKKSPDPVIQSSETFERLIQLIFHGTACTFLIWNSLKLLDISRQNSKKTRNITHDWTFFLSKNWLSNLQRRKQLTTFWIMWVASFVSFDTIKNLATFSHTSLCDVWNFLNLDEIVCWKRRLFVFKFRRCSYFSWESASLSSVILWNEENLPFLSEIERLIGLRLF